MPIWTALASWAEGSCFMLYIPVTLCPNDLSLPVQRRITFVSPDYSGNYGPSHLQLIYYILFLFSSSPWFFLQSAMPRTGYNIPVEVEPAFFRISFSYFCTFLFHASVSKPMGCQLLFNHSLNWFCHVQWTMHTSTWLHKTRPSNLYWEIFHINKWMPLLRLYCRIITSKTLHGFKSLLNLILTFSAPKGTFQS